MAFIYDLADTWSSGTTTFTGIKLNVTDTASASTSNLIDLQVAGVSKFRVQKNGRMSFGSTGVYATEGIIVFNDFAGGSVGSTSIYGTYTDVLISTANQTGYNFGHTQFTIKGISPIAWSSNLYNTISPVDLLILRDAANTLAQRNGTNAQAFNIYNTYTNDTNYERGFIRFVSNVLEIGAQGAGTGTGRAVKLYSLIDLELHNEQGSGYVHITKSGNNSGKLQLSGGSAFGGGLIEGRNTKNGVLTGHLQFGGSGSGGNTILDAIYTGAKLYLRSQNTDRLILDSVGTVQIVTALTVATLPVTPLVGMIARVTDASSPTTGSTIAGGGAAAALCWYNGTDWKVIGV